MNNEEVTEINFTQTVLDELLSCKTINLFTVWELSEELKVAYEISLSYYRDALENIFYGDVINTMREASRLFHDKTINILKRIKKIRCENNGKKRLEKSVRI